MKMSLLYFSFAAAVCASMNAAEAASFNCAPYYKKRQCPETVICDTPRLSRMDSRMAARYGALIDSLPPNQARRLRNDQRNWLARRNACDCNASCIERRYENRLEDLRGY